MGTGKTSVAKILSARLGMKYVSTDDMIEKKEGISIREIFLEKGESYFREIEKDVIKAVSLEENAVIDAGGGVVIDADNVKNLKKSGIVICLWAEPEIILQRTKRYAERPLLNVADPLGKIKELLEYRKPFYERADYHINTSGMSAEEVAHETERTVKNVRRDQR